jgi:osmotically-inducible protein OsmY
VQFEKGWEDYQMAAKSKGKPGIRPDDDVARDIRQCMKLDSDVPDERIRVEVHNGLATLNGNVDESFQKEAAEADAKKVKGVQGVANRIEVQPAMPGTQAR